jgi:hypothetical protein
VDRSRFSGRQKRLFSKLDETGALGPTLSEAARSHALDSVRGGWTAQKAIERQGDDELFHDHGNQRRGT